MCKKNDHKLLNAISQAIVPTWIHCSDSRFHYQHPHSEDFEEMEEVLACERMNWLNMGSLILQEEVTLMLE